MFGWYTVYLSARLSWKDKVSAPAEFFPFPPQRAKVQEILQNKQDSADLLNLQYLYHGRIQLSLAYCSSNLGAAFIYLLVDIKPLKPLIQC